MSRDRHKPPPANPRTPPRPGVADPGAPGWDAPRAAVARAQAERDERTAGRWRATLARIVAMLTVLALAALGVAMTSWDAESATRVLLAAIAAVLVVLRGPRSGGPPALVIAAAAEVGALAVHAVGIFS